MKKHILLTEEVATEIAGAIHRLNELGDSTIINPANEAEVKGLRAFLANTLPQYANELVGGWFVLNREYEPLVQGMTGLLGRALANIDARSRPQQPAPAPADPVKDAPAENVIPLNS